MSFLISYGAETGRATYGRATAEDALLFAKSLEAAGHTRIRVTDASSEKTYDISQFQRWIAANGQPQQ